MVTISPLPGKPRGNLESYTFPTEAVVKEEKSWSAIVHNNGGATGVVGFGIGNKSGNPDSIQVTFGGVAHTIPPGSILYLRYADIAVCSRINCSGTVIFWTEGHYTIRLAGAHKEDTTWIIDTFKDVG